MSRENGSPASHAGSGINLELREGQELVRRLQPHKSCSPKSGAQKRRKHISPFLLLWLESGRRRSTSETRSFNLENE